jgi:hypothetical protein
MMAITTDNFIFKVPDSPQEFGVVLAPPNLRNLDFSALDYQAMERAGIEYIRSYFGQSYNDYYASNGAMMLLELVAYMSNILSERSDILIDEAFLPTAQTKEAVIEHLALINQEILRATPATVDIAITVPNKIPTEVRIPAGISFSVAGPDGSAVNFEVFRAPGDFTSDIIIPPGRRGVIAYGIEGSTANLQRQSNGGPDQYIDIMETNVLDDPISVFISTGAAQTQWRRVEVIATAGATDRVYQVSYLGDRTRILFGDGNSGAIPISGQMIGVSYRTGGGSRGRIGTGILNDTRPIAPQPPSSAGVEVSFSNPSPSIGGTDEETIDQARKRAPQEFSTHNSATTSEDYSILAVNYNHPVFGSVSKAVGTIRTGVDADLDVVVNAIRSAPTVDAAKFILQNNYVNRNIVEIYVLTAGPDNVPQTPSAGLRQGLVSYFSDINVLTDEIRILDGKVKPVDVKATIVVNRNADPGTVKVAVNLAIRNFFDIQNFSMGTGLYISNLYNLLQAIPGIKNINLFEPSTNIIPISKTSSASSGSTGSNIGVEFNEVITLGNVDLKFFFEQGSFRIPAVHCEN